MKFALVILACISLVAAASFCSKKGVKIADKHFLKKQKFLFEIVYRVRDPLYFEEWIKYGDKFVVDKSYYNHYNIYMEKFWESWKMGTLLPKGKFFGALVETHHKQAWGLFNFFYYTKDLKTFVHNVCWARIHVNEGMFVYALTLAVIHREDFHGLALPSIYEIFPEHFFNSKFVYKAEKFDYDVWSLYTMYEKELYDVYYKSNKTYDYRNFYVKDWKTWQWWKMMGLGEHWYPEEKFILRENIREFNQDPKWITMMKDVKKWWMPIDYTRDVETFNEHSKLSYFTEDLGWNAFWYYFNMDYALFLDGKTFGLSKGRRGEYWLYTVQQLISRYNIERLSHGFGKIPGFSWNSKIEYGYNLELISYNGVGFSYRNKWWEVQKWGNSDMLSNIYNTFNRINDIIDLEYYKTADGIIVHLRKPEAIEYIGNLLQGNINSFDKYFFTYWYVLSHMYFADVKYKYNVYPNVLLNFETMLRDPLFYIFYKKIADVYHRFNFHFQPYRREELFFPGVEIKDVHVDKLVTFFDLVDFDVTNLLNDTMTFVDGQFTWDKALFARQARLNHKPFTYDFNVESDKANKVVVRTFYGPKFDEFGRLISLADNRENFVEFDEFLYDLVPGKNVIKRSSNDFYWTVKDRTTYTELYKSVMLAYEGKFDYLYEISQPRCGFPDRLILPHGWVKGMPMQFFFMVTPYVAELEQFENNDHTYSCGVKAGVCPIDNKPFGYPFNRIINEYEFYVPNMFFKDVKVYHVDTFETYFEKYEHYGHFDYSFFYDYYTKYFKY